MSRRQRQASLRSGFNLGGEQAEADPLLEQAFVEWAGYHAVESQRDARRFLVGRTGSGKSAVLQRLEEVHPGHVIRINPEDLSLPYIVDLDVIRYLDALNVHLDPLFTALWKHVLVVEIIRHRYKVDSPAKKQTVLETLRQTFSRDASKQAALEYLDDFGESFWADTDERVREITTNFEDSVKKIAKVGIDIPTVATGHLGIEGLQAATTAVRTEYAARYQRLVNETQLPRLNKMIAALDDEILASEQNFTYVAVDDLDRDWVDEKIANDLIRCLFRAVLDLQRVANLKVVVALRTNIFDHLNFGARAGGQEEKYRALVFRIQWTRAELMAMADERARVAAEEVDIPNIRGVGDLLPQTGKAKALDVFRGAPYEMTQTEITTYLDGVALLMVDPEFEGVLWITEVADPLWLGAVAPEAWADSYQSLVKFFYDIGFLGISEGSAMAFAHDKPGFADTPGNLRASSRYSIHPAFQTTLGVRQPPRGARER